MNPVCNDVFEISTVKDLETTAQRGLDALNAYPDEEYYDMVGFEGPGDSSNPFGVLKHLLDQEESKDKVRNVDRAYYNCEELGDNPILERFESLDSFIETVEELDAYVENVLGYEKGQGIEEPESLEMYQREAEAVNNAITGFYRVLI